MIGDGPSLNTSLMNWDKVPTHKPSREGKEMEEN